ncbi:hypothetical protein A1O7_09653 [Cladophialophora yegresii CBS 114405]|uniref:Ankyrin repeat protein n=1 Tax=Cladophialophora yegresii CBS 114405 TaxID=1182544 RepID=W9VMS3_9EURO|nr:uncharacterized protein A1O7_09653 [Cladophialophora yegresii CBS 114405]EXJ54315.1 hypothetical protein A1O7_09653 [Cladophialophora yegresii CBS 114405]
MAAMELPPLPVPICDFVSYVEKRPKAPAGVAEAVKPFKAFENKLREVYAQHPDHPAAAGNHLLPVFDNDILAVRARDLANESPAEKDKYLLPLPEDTRRKTDAPATVQSLKEFKTNFNLFSESSLVDLDWNNVVCAGSAVVTSLLPVDAPHNESKRALRSYYHENLAPASDVDLFLYGLDREQAMEKVKQIESKIRDSILAETTTVRTKNAITIVSQYPIRHVQIVLRLYRSVSEILTGFDVDCSCVAYDGKQVWASPRALAAFMTQMNTIDLSRRSPSYENRLSKYSRRGFEVYWPLIDRSRVDPTIFERSFSRVLGLARLLVLEKLPHPNDRDTYLAKRRAERGRPPLPWNARFRHELPGNVKDAQPDDVAEWVEEDEVSNYHTVTIPYGPKYHAKKIEKLLFTKDLLLNAEWNKPKDRETQLHRHPAFFGSANDVLHDCCGFCPKPVTVEDVAAFEEESKIYISGNVTFVMDDPGRQAIGSFNPITDDDWTDMAYVGNTTRLCQAIVDLDLDAVRDWFSSPEVVDVNRRDHTGRTPLQLAVMCSTPEIVQCLIEHGARLVARLYNGMTALHLAAYRGEVQMVKDILDKSDANEEAENIKEAARRDARRAGSASDTSSENGSQEQDSGDVDSFDSDGDFDHEAEVDDVTEGSFVKVNDNVSPDENGEEDEPDVYDVDVLAWDSPLSPLHLAILAGHLDVIELLVDSYGADVLLPIKIVDEYNRKRAKAAILTMTLALELPLQQANETVRVLLERGATHAQADMNHISALNYAVNSAKTLILETMHSADPSHFASACNFIAISGYFDTAKVNTPLLTAIRTGKPEIVDNLVRWGAKTHIDFESYAQAYRRSFDRPSNDPEIVKKTFQKTVEQPLFVALQHDMVDFVAQLVDAGEDVNSLPARAYKYLEYQYSSWNSAGKSLLDLVEDRVTSLRQYLQPADAQTLEKPASLEEDSVYLDGFEAGSYSYWTASEDLCDAKSVHRYQTKQYEKELNAEKESSDEAPKKAAINNMLEKLLNLKSKLCEKGAKSFWELHPEGRKEEESRRALGYRYGFNQHSTEPYRTKISFKVPDLTPEKEANYIKLFEAAWHGNVETLKSLCLHGERPLHIAVYDLRGFSPFSIAAIRGHYELAHIIIEIAKAQYQPDNKSVRYHYRLRTEEDDNSYSDGSSDDGRSEGSDNVRLHAEVVDEAFTVEDVAALEATTVVSRVSPSTMVAWHCQVARALRRDVDQREVKDVFGDSLANHRRVYIGDQSKQSWAWFNAVFGATSQAMRRSLVRYAIFTDDMTLLRFLIKVGNELAAQIPDGNNDSLRVMNISQDDFGLAVRLGRVEMIGEIIKSTGYGFPLQKVFQKSGIKLDEKPKYYQGLSVHGRKRQDWAEAGRGGRRSHHAESDIGVPLLAAAIEGNTDSTEFFLTDAPLRRYLEFAESLEDEKRIQALAQAKGGIKGTLSAWLSTRNQLVLHVGVLSPPREDGSQPTFDLLLEKMPDAVGVRAADGKTPLHLAFEVERYYAAKKLIAAGANQATKDHVGRNILHTMLDTIPIDKPDLLRSVIDMLDKTIVVPLLLERCSTIESTGNTPLAVFLGRITKHHSGWQESLKFLLLLSGGKDLEKMDGAGEYPLHTGVRKNHRELVQFIVEFRPDLLYWENATGMTVSDIATTSYLCHRIEHPPKLNESEKRHIEDQPASDFMGTSQDEVEDQDRLENEDEDEDGSGRGQAWRMRRFISGLVAKYPGKRKLVGLHDANEVAKRLAMQQQKQNEENRRRERLGLKATGLRRRYRYDNGVVDMDADPADEVEEYTFRAKGFIKWDELVWRKTEAGETTGPDGQDIAREYIRRGSDASVQGSV